MRCTIFCFLIELPMDKRRITHTCKVYIKVWIAIFLVESLVAILVRIGRINSSISL